MSKRRLGRTNLYISELTIGGGWVGGLIDQPDDVKRALVDRGRAGGINWIDTAAAYGQGQSEAAIGRIGRRRRPYVSTKVRLDPAWDTDFAAQIRDLGGQLVCLKMSSCRCCNCIIRSPRPVTATVSRPNKCLATAGF